MTRRSRCGGALAAAFAALSLAARAQEPPAAPAGHAQGDCTRCHAATKAATELPVPHKPAQDGECVRCHAPHAARYEKLLNQRERALCAACHADAIVEFMKGSVHTPIKDGECTACHEVHGSVNAALLARTGNELCTGCHQEKHAQLSLGTVHEPFATGECGDCHLPHNSPYPDQLTAPATKLCGVCHVVDSPEITEAHYGIAVKGTACTACHEPHASATKGLLRRVVHSPFGEGSCELCHMLDTETPQLVRATGARLCNVCHKGYPREGDAVVHKPVADGSCNACHVPHASEVQRLLPQPAADLCATCHADLVERAAKSKSAHRVDREKDACLACHAPHSSSEPHLLSAGEIRTCLVCHETAKHGHPLGDDRLDPRTQKPITCVTCHDPHGTAYPYHLRGDQSRGLCLECHDTQHETPKRKSGGTARD